MRKSAKKKRRKQKELADGQVVEEEPDNEGDESSVDSLMAESPAKYGDGKAVDDEAIDRATVKKIPKRRPPTKPTTAAQVKKVLSPRSKLSQDKKEGIRPRSQAANPRRIKREDTKELFPSLAIEGVEQRKLFKIAESIGGMANQIANKRIVPPLPPVDSVLDQERMERMK